MSKKTFKKNINPALQFISKEIEDDIEEIEITNEEYVPMKLNPKYVETRSKQVTVLTKPSIHKKLVKHASQEKESVNEIINRAFEEYLDKRNI